MVTITEPTAIQLDADTAQTITRLSRLLNVSESEVVRRSVEGLDQKEGREQKATPQQIRDALEALESLQANAHLTAEEIAAWEKDRREGWEESFALLEERRNRQMNQAHDPS
jgi:Arc/MetJ-type ribon-helix-helix transcriptional regulator